MDSRLKREKKLAYLLRHDKEYSFDENGWRDVTDLVANYHYTVEELYAIVETSNKKRFEFSADHTKIRACQGHSVQVDVLLDEAYPPDVLFHGTAVHSVDSICRDGLKSMSRLYVHFSATREEAVKVGMRHGIPVILSIDARQMTADGYKFYLSANGVWLTRFVDKKYIKAVPR